MNWDQSIETRLMLRIEMLTSDNRTCRYEDSQSQHWAMQVLTAFGVGDTIICEKPSTELPRNVNEAQARDLQPLLPA
jgi:hypothetical protein